MSMTVVVTRNVSGRFRGFLASVMCEVAPGVYTAPRMNAGVRDRVWGILEGWWTLGSDAMIVMTWPDRHLPGGQEVKVLGGSPGEADAQPQRRELVQHDGVYLARTPLSRAELLKLLERDESIPF